jgi:WD40 repeat protein
MEDLSMLAIGADSGDLVIIDCNNPKSELVRSDLHDDSINSMVYNPPKKILITASGDGHIMATTVKKSKIGKLHGESECLEDEVLSMALMNGGTRIVTGTGLGVVNIFNWGYYGVPSHRIKGFNSEINCICKVDEDRAVIGTSDGLIQIINGQKKGQSICVVNGAVESMAYCNEIVALLDQNGLVWIWPLSDLTSSPDSKTEPSEAVEDKVIDRQSFLDGFS